MIFAELLHLVRKLARMKRMKPWRWRVAPRQSPFPRSAAVQIYKKTANKDLSFGSPVVLIYNYLQ